MKKVFPFLCLCYFSLQLANAQTALDFTFTDTKGVTHNLQQTLDGDTTVLLDIFFVECPPCQDSAPELASIAQTYASSPFVIWSLSDRDDNADIEMFKDSFNLVFPAGGIEGGATEIIELYQDSFFFQGFPTISVICPDGTINWDIWPYTPGAEEWRNAIEACGVMVNVEGEIAELDAALLAPNPATNESLLRFDLRGISRLNIGLFNAQGAKVNDVFQGRLSAGTHSMDVDLSSLPAGAYWVRITNEAGQTKSLPLQKF